MELRRRKKDGSPFWGCTRYPECRGVQTYIPVIQAMKRPRTMLNRYGASAASERARESHRRLGLGERL